jgi:hypothetical protein
LAYKIRKIEFLTILMFGGMVLLIPVITSNALAFTEAKVTSLPSFSGCCPFRFSDVRWHIDSCGDSGCGDFVVTPHRFGDELIIWSTMGTATFLGGGTEKGFVDASFNAGNGGTGTVRFYFNNPSSGPNTCSVDFISHTGSQKLGGQCSISHGNTAYVNYYVCAGNSNVTPGGRC